MTPAALRSIMERMFELAPFPWRRIERRRGPNPGADFVEVGECVRCRRGVDRAFPTEYRMRDGELLCADCAGRRSRTRRGASVSRSQPAA